MLPQFLSDFLVLQLLTCFPTLRRVGRNPTSPRGYISPFGAFAISLFVLAPCPSLVRVLLSIELYEQICYVHRCRLSTQRVPIWYSKPRLVGETGLEPANSLSPKQEPYIWPLTGNYNYQI